MHACPSGDTHISTSELGLKRCISTKILIRCDSADISVYAVNSNINNRLFAFCGRGDRYAASGMWSGSSNFEFFAQIQRINGWINVRDWSCVIWAAKSWRSEVFGEATGGTCFWCSACVRAFLMLHMFLIPRYIKNVRSDHLFCQ